MLLDSRPTTTWGIAEIVLASDTPHAHPFRDVDLTVSFRSPGGREVVVRGFHDGGRVWRARLMPDEEGAWGYTTSSGDPQLDAITGTIDVGPAPADSHGPVRVAEGRHFAYADGTPYFLLGTTLYGGLTGGAAETNRTVSRLVDSPFTKARFMMFGGLLTSPATARPPFERDASGALDFTRPDPAFYRELENGLAQVHALGVEADLILFVPYFDAVIRGAADANPSTMGQDADEWYVRYVVSRLAAFSNVWWTLANEFDLHRVQKDWDRLAAIVADADPYGHLLSNHHSILGFFDNSAPWVTHANLQDVLLQRSAAGPRNLAELALDARGIGKPVVVDEYGYEGNNGFTWGSFSGPEMVEMHWAVALAGAYGSHGESFTGADGPRFVGDAVPRLRFLREVLESTPFQRMEPAADILAYAGDAFVPLALAVRGEDHLIYVSSPRELPDWNLGNFGPATPSKPLPLPVGGTFVVPDTAIRITVPAGRYDAELIDPWRMTVTALGVTDQHDFTFEPRLTPGILRLRRTTSSDASPQPVADLMRRFAGWPPG